MTTALVTFWELKENQFLARLGQVLEDAQLIHTASELKELLNLTDTDEIYWAIRKAIKTVKTLNINSKRHFKRIYRAENNSLSVDWRLSRLAYLLVILNCNSDHPLVAKLQVELIKNRLSN
tara:strand:- start:1147 stop:1509 length:363 start_codon:yes stop_codon:yes gene_type:complete